MVSQSQPSGEAGTPQPRPAPEAEAFCGLCGEPVAPSDLCEEVRAVAGFDICAKCIEDELNASTDEPRTEVGLVGGCDSRP